MKQLAVAVAIVLAISVVVIAVLLFTDDEFPPRAKWLAHGLIVLTVAGMAISAGVHAESAAGSMKYLVVAIVVVAATSVGVLAWLFFVDEEIEDSVGYMYSAAALAAVGAAIRAGVRAKQNRASYLEWVMASLGLTVLAWAPLLAS